MSEPLARIPVGIVVERHDSTTPWADYVWRPVAALPGDPDTPAWTILSTEGDRTTFYAGHADVALHRSETAHYQYNLASGTPSLWVVLRPSDGDPPYTLFLVTADPSEGEAYTESGADLVESVPMPGAVRDVIDAFVAEHHVDQPFYKRERQRAEPDTLGRAPPVSKGERP